MPDRDDDSPYPRAMCLVCRARLSPKENLMTGGMEYVHLLKSDHDPRPVQEVEAGAILVCDFCLTPHPTWDLPAGPMNSIVDDDQVFFSSSDWAACDTCKDLVIANKLADLCARVHAALIMRDPSIDTSETRRALVASGILQQMQDFMRVRTGPPIPVESAWVTSKLLTIVEAFDAH